MKHKNNKGFTIVELMIASTILTVVLVGASFVLVQVGRLYYKGVITARTQDAARNIIESISRPTQLEAADIIDSAIAPNPDGWSVVCVGNQRFSFKQGVLATAGATGQVFLKDRVTSLANCTVPAAAGDPGVESLLSNNMQLVDLVIQDSGVDGTTDIRVVVAYGNEIQSDAGGFSCTQQANGGQWCAVASYSTRIFPRLGQ